MNASKITVRVPRANFWEPEGQPISVIVNGLCNHADYRFEMDESCDYQAESVAGRPQPLYESQVMICNRCNAWKYADGIFVDGWRDESFEEAEDD